jgi:hypothetical protein
MFFNKKHYVYYSKEKPMSFDFGISMLFLYLSVLYST